MRPFEGRLPAIHHQLGVPAGEQDESVAPGRVAQDAAAQQQLVVVERVRLLIPRQRSVELVEIVVRRLADHLAC